MLKRIVEASLKRQAALDKIYTPKFQSLNKTETLKLAKSGDVWWNHVDIQHFQPNLSQKTISLLCTIDSKSTALKGHQVDFNDSSVWKAFRLAMTHHSTAIEGNQLNELETELVINEYDEEISKGVGISQHEMVMPPQLWMYNDKDVREVINHAAAMEYLKNNLFQKTYLTVDDIVNLHRVLMPRSCKKYLSMTGLDENHMFRRIPIHVTGSPAIRPYPHEIPAVMNKFITHYQQSSYIASLHPVVVSTLFATDFLHIHPFDDGNGRTARLLLVHHLYNRGFLACIIHKKQRSEYLSQFDKYFVEKEAEPMIHFIAKCVNTFLDDI